MVTSSIVDRITSILMDLREKSGSIESIFLVDLTSSEILTSYPKDENLTFELLASITGNMISKFESETKYMNYKILIKEFEILTQNNERVFVSKVSKDISLCIIGGNGFTSSFTKRIIDTYTIDALRSTFEKMGLPL